MYDHEGCRFHCNGCENQLHLEDSLPPLNKRPARKNRYEPPLVMNLLRSVSSDLRLLVHYITSLHQLAWQHLTGLNCMTASDMVKLHEPCQTTLNRALNCLLGSKCAGDAFVSSESCNNLCHSLPTLKPGEHLLQCQSVQCSCATSGYTWWQFKKAVQAADPP